MYWIFVILSQTEYLALADQLSNYVVALVDNVRNHEELELLLNKKKRDPDDPTYELLSRLKLAIYYNEKRVSKTIILASN